MRVPGRAVRRRRSLGVLVAPLAAGVSVTNVRGRRPTGRITVGEERGGPQIPGSRVGEEKTNILYYL